MKEQTQIRENVKPTHGIQIPVKSPNVKTRWHPKREQIVILETIFNNGSVNPNREELTKIRGILEKFGPIQDSNVFYWFQNRRSRIRRKQRELIQAAAAAAVREQQQLEEVNNNGIGSENLATGAGEKGFHDSDRKSSDLTSLQDQTGYITVFINEVETKIPKEAIDIREMFGKDMILVDYYGVPISINRFGLLMPNQLRHGEAYFLIPRP